MVFEFCVRWTVNAYDSSYGNYLMHTYGVDSGAYSCACFLSIIASVLFCIQSTVICLEQLFFYPMMVEKLHFPIPYLAAAGQLLEVVFYWLMVSVPNKMFSMVCATLLWVSYSMSTPAPISIVSVGVE